MVGSEMQKGNPPSLCKPFPVSHQGSVLYWENVALCVSVAACTAVQEWTFKYTSNSGSPLTEDFIWLLKPHKFSVWTDTNWCYALVQIAPVLGWNVIWGLTLSSDLGSPIFQPMMTFPRWFGSCTRKDVSVICWCCCSCSADSRAIRARENGCSSHGGLQVCSLDKKIQDSNPAPAVRERLVGTSNLGKRFLFSPHLASSSLCLENTSFLDGKHSVPCSAHRTLISQRTWPASVFWACCW